jgi:predicted transglutaminase-like cysteine proteinase
MVRSRVSVTPRRGLRALLICPLFVTGLAIACAAAPLTCLSSLNVLAGAPRVGERHFAEYGLPGAQSLLRSSLWNGTAAGLADVTDGAQQLTSFESRFASAQSLLRSDLRNGMAAGLARLAGGRPQAIQFASFESRFPGAQSPPAAAALRGDMTADLASVANALQPGLQFIRFDEPTLAPMAFTQFCLNYPGDCKSQRLLFEADRIALDRMRWLELEAINRAVNSSIHPARNENGLAGEKWLLSPLRGDCNDYAVTKRHQLIARGWPARDVLLSEVVTVAGEHHLVTVVRTSGGDLVLDNLTDVIKPWSRTTYRWVRIQTPKDPNYWASVASQNI